MKLKVGMYVSPFWKDLSMLPLHQAKRSENIIVNG